MKFNVVIKHQNGSTETRALVASSLEAATKLADRLLHSRDQIYSVLADEDFVKVFESILLIQGGSQKAFDYLYNNRNLMTKEQFQECLVDYGAYVYRCG